MLKQFWAWFLEIAPAGFEPQSGFFGAACTLMFLFLGLTWKAWSKILTDAIGAWLQDSSRVSLVTVALLSVVVGAVAGALWTAGGMLLLACLLALRQHFSPRRWKTRSLVALFAGLLVVSLPAEVWIQRHLQRLASQRLTVYVVLPLGGISGEDLDELLALSKSLRDTIDRIFETHSEVRVEPSVLVQRQDLDKWRELSPVVDRLTEEGLPPDVVLENLASLIEDDQTYIKFLLQLRIADGNGEFSEAGIISGSGRKDHFSYLVLQASLDMIEQLAKSRYVDLAQPEGRKLIANVMQEYRQALSLDDGAPQTAIESAASVVGDPAIDLEVARAIVGAYPADESQLLKDILAARNRTALAKLATAPAETTDPSLDQPTAEVP